MSIENSNLPTSPTSEFEGQEDVDTNPYYEEIEEDEISSVSETWEIENATYIGKIVECVTTTVDPNRTSIEFLILLQYIVEDGKLEKLEDGQYFRNRIHSIQFNPFRSLLDKLHERGVEVNSRFFIGTSLKFVIKNKLKNGINFSNISEMTLRNWKKQA